MKALLLIFFVSCASAIDHDDFRKASDEVMDHFISGMSNAPSLHLSLGIPDTEEVRKFESDVKEELANYLRKVFDEALEKIKDAIKNGKEVHKEALNKLLLLKEEMKSLKITEDELAGKVLDDIKAMVSGQLKELLIRLGIIEREQKRAIEDDDILGDINIRNLIIKLKEMILDKMDIGSLKKSIANLVGKGTQRLCEWLTVRGKEKVLGFFDRLLDEDVDKKKRSVSDLYEEIKDYFEGLDLEFKQKFTKFGEWVKEVLEKGLDRSKSRIEKVKTIAKELVEKSKVISKEVASQALVYLKNYKEELGELYYEVRRKLVEKIMDYTD